MNMQEIRHGMGSWWASVAEGWDRLRQSAAGAPPRAACRSWSHCIRRGGGFAP